MINLCFALIHSHLLYGLPVWASTCKMYLTKIRVLQNKAISIISEIPHKERVSPYYYKLQILKLDDLYQFELVKLCTNTPTINYPYVFAITLLTHAIPILTPPRITCFFRVLLQSELKSP